MATNVPPHNLPEVIDGLVMMIDNPEVTVQELMSAIKGRTFPRPGFIHGIDGIRQAYTTGRGIIHMRARAFIEAGQGGQGKIIVVTELLPGEQGPSVEKIGELSAGEENHPASQEIRDESDREGMRIVVELKRGEITNVILNQLLQAYGHAVHLRRDHAGPREQPAAGPQPAQAPRPASSSTAEVVVRRTRYDLRKAEERAHILLGLKIALRTSTR